MSRVRLSLSKAKDGGKRHIVLRTDSVHGLAIKPVIATHVLQGEAVPVIRYRGEDMIAMFNIRYLDRLTMTFPDAELSAGLRRRMQREAQKRLDAMDVPEVHVPGFQGDLYDFQAQGVATTVDRLEDDGVFMLNDEMGLGKTIQALATAIKMKKKRILVVTTKSGCGSWAKILRNLFPKVKYVVIEGDSAKREAIVRTRKVRVTLVNFEALRVAPFDAQGQPWVKKKSRGKKVWKPVNPAIFNVRWDMLITDEFHKCKNPESQQTQGLLCLPKAEAELMMSGTPFLNNPLELWPVLHRLWPQKFPSYWAFERNLVIKDGRKVVGYNPDQMIELRDFLAAHSLRRRKDQVGIQLPEVIYSTRLCGLTPEQRRLYKKIKDEFQLLLDDGSVKSIVGALPQITRLKQACFSPELYGGSKQSAKLIELREIVEELVASGEKAIIFSQWEEACQIIAREFAEYNPAYVTGKVTGYAKVDGVRMTKRSIQEDKFNNDDSCKLYIGTIAANQEAITLSAATYVIFTDKAWTPLANDQAIARSAAGGLRGVGTTVPVNVIELFAEDTFEARIEELLTYKKGLFDRMVEADGGVKDKRKKVEGVTIRELRDLL